MHLGKALTLFCLSSGAVSFKIRAFSEDDCKGDAKEVNVWDNTCRNTDIFDTKSFRVLAYGIGTQRAAFWKGPACSKIPYGEPRSFWADGGSDNFKKDKCITIGYTAKAYGSSSGI